MAFSAKRKGVFELIAFSVVPVSAHAAFDKAAEYLKIKIHTIPVDPETRKVDISRLKRAMYVFLAST